LTFGNLYHFCVAEPLSRDKDKYYPETLFFYLVSSLVLVHKFFAPSIFFSCFIIKVSVFCFQALALSMGTPLEFAGTGEIQNQSDWTRNKKIKVSKNIGVAERGKDLHSALPPDVSGHRQRRRKQKNQGGRSQFTEGELDALFALFDDKGRGRLSVADIAYVATAHDFAWSKDELSDMVEFFDSNQDGMVSKSVICNSPDQQFPSLQCCVPICFCF
jgi:hypothetical protein